MLELVGEAFDTRHDPGQISVSEEERELLEKIHPDTLSELANENGPIVWLLLVPTTAATMQQFLARAITEKQLLFQTVPGAAYDAIYLCSASVLPEFRKQGLAKKVAMNAINNIRKAHNIATLYYWPFTTEGRELAVSIARDADLVLLEKKEL